MTAREPSEGRPPGAAAASGLATAATAASGPATAASGPAAVDAYLSTLPEAVAARLETVRALVRRIVPEATETMSYGIPTFDLGGRHLVHVGGYRGHIGLYPGSGAVAAFAVELVGAGYRTRRGTIQLPHDRPLPLDLVERIVRFRVAEERARAATAPGRERGRGRAVRRSSSEGPGSTESDSVGD